MLGTCSDSATRGVFSDSASAPVAASRVSWARVAANCGSDLSPKYGQIHGNIVDLFELVDVPGTTGLAN